MVDPDQTGAVSPGPTLFVYESSNSLVNDKKYVL